MKKLLAGILMSCLASAVFAIDGNVICSKAQNVQDQWVGIMSGRAPLMPLCNQAVRGEPFSVNIFFLAPTIKNGKVRVSCKLSMTDTAGKEKFSNQLNTLEFDCKDSSSVFLFPEYLQNSFDPPDALGEYTFTAELKDENSGETKKAKTTVKLVEKNTLPADKEPMSAMVKFYSQPASQNIIPAFQELLKQLPEIKQKQGKGFNPVSMLALFYYALEANPQLWKEFAKNTEKINDTESRSYAVAIMHELGDKAFSMLSEQSRKTWNPQMSGMFKVGDDIVAPEQLDILWAEFLITGKREPVMRIAKETFKLNGNTSIDDFKKIKNPTDEDKKSVTRFVVGMAATWSLTSNAQQHRLVAEYLECALARNEFKNDNVNSIVSQILAGLNDASKPQNEK